MQLLRDPLPFAGGRLLFDGDRVGRARELEQVLRGGRREVRFRLGIWVRAPAEDEHADRLALGAHGREHVLRRERGGPRRRRGIVGRAMRACRTLLLKGLAERATAGRAGDRRGCGRVVAAEGPPFR